VIQGFADQDLLSKFNYLSTVSGGGYIGSWLSAWLHHSRQLPGKAKNVLKALKSARQGPDYESPKSDNQETRQEQLKLLRATTNASNTEPHDEPPQLAHLRDYSNYLTPRVGLFSADTWAAVAIVLRNIVINWLILLPVLALVVISVKLAVLFMTTGTDGGALTPGLVATVCLLSGAMAFGYKLARLYSGADVRRLADNRKAGKRAQGGFILWSLTPAMLGGACFVWLALHKPPETPAAGLAEAHWVPQFLNSISALLPEFLKSAPPCLSAWMAEEIMNLVRACWSLVLVLFFAGAVYGLALAGAAVWASTRVPYKAPGAGHRFALRWWDGLAWLGGAAIFATIVWLGVMILGWVGEGVTPVPDVCVTITRACVSKPRSESITINPKTLAAIFGIPWFLLTTILAHTGYLLFRSMSFRGDVEREWLGRGHFIAALGWMILTAVLLFGPSIYENIPLTIHVLTVVAGTITAWLGKSGVTSATGGAADDWKGLSAKIALAVSGPVFAVLLLMLLSVTIDWAVRGSTQAYACFPTAIDLVGYWGCDGDWIAWARPFAVILVVPGVANCLANINAFSLHAVYRNRLIRCFLGAARAPDREPDGFTDFDWGDDLRVAQLWREDDDRPDEEENWRPLHVINMTLNLTEPNKLAWQQRKAMPFSVSPFFCGNADLGYRPTDRYGGRGRIDPKTKQTVSGITLGTAMAISGAAVSSNMGYHSSMSLSFLLTFFNVRLGVWLGNPGWRRSPWQQRFLPAWLQHWWRPYRYAGPRFAARPLVSELFGLISADSPTSTCRTVAISRIWRSTRWCGGAANGSLSSMPGRTQSAAMSISETPCARSGSIWAFASHLTTRRCSWPQKTPSWTACRISRSARSSISATCR
jgi:hypothetical protein